MTPPEDAIRARRRLTNKLIAGKDATRLRPFFDPAVVVIVQAFAAQFQDPDFTAYVRTADEVAVAHDGERAAERGTWVAVSRSRGEHISGWYLAAWKKVRGQWLIESETFVTLTER